MPFDAGHDPQRPDPFSLEGLIAWLETQPPETKYDWMSWSLRFPDGGCLLLRYGAAVGDAHDMHNWFYKNQLMHVASALPWTYGAALDRARAALAGQKQKEQAVG